MSFPRSTRALLASMMILAASFAGCTVTYGPEDQVPTSDLATPGPAADGRESPPTGAADGGPSQLGYLLPATSSTRAPHPVEIAGRLTSATWAGAYAGMDHAVFSLPQGVDAKVGPGVIVERPDGRRLDVNEVAVRGARVTMDGPIGAVNWILTDGKLQIGGDVGDSNIYTALGGEIRGYVSIAGYEGTAIVRPNSSSGSTMFGITFPGRADVESFSGKHEALRTGTGRIAEPPGTFRIVGMVGENLGTFRTTRIANVTGVELVTVNFTLAPDGAFTLKGNATQLWSTQSPRLPCVFTQTGTPEYQAPSDPNASIVVRIPFRVSGPGSATRAISHAPGSGEGASFGPALIVKPGEDLPDEWLPNFFPFLFEAIDGQTLEPDTAYEVAFRAGNFTAPRTTTFRATLDAEACDKVELTVTLQR